MSSTRAVGRTHNHLGDGIFADVVRRRSATIGIEERLDGFCRNPLRPFRWCGEGAFVLRPENLVFEDVEVDQRAAVHVVPDGQLSVERRVVFEGITEFARVG